MNNNTSDNTSKSGNFLDKYIEPVFYRSMRIAILAVIGTYLMALILFIIGIIKSVNLIKDFQQDMDLKLLKIQIIGIADLFIFGLAIMILAFGIYKLFVGKVKPLSDNKLPVWLQNINDFGALKIIIAKIVILVLILLFLELIIENFQRFQTGNIYQLLVIPIGVLLIAFALKIIEKIK
jgi:uncharacterized membrane protein YqhA